MSRQAMAAEVLGTPQASAPVNPKAVKRQERSDRQMLAQYNLGEIALMKRFGASKEDLAAEKAANSAEVSAMKAAQKPDGYFQPDHITATAATYADKPFATQVGGVLQEAEGLFEDYNLPQYHRKDGKKGSYTLTGFNPHTVIRAIANKNEDGTYNEKKSPILSKMIPFIEATHDTELSEADLSAYGKIKAIKKSPGMYRVMPAGNGKTQAATGYFTKDADGNYKSVGYDNFYYKKPESSGGFFGSGIGTLFAVAAAVMGQPYLAAAMGGPAAAGAVGAAALGTATIGSSIAAGAITGGLSAGLTGGNVGMGILTGGIGGGIGAGLGGADISQGFGATIDASKAWAPFGGASGDWMNTAARGAASGLATGTLNGNPMLGATGGAVGGALNGLIPGNGLLESATRFGIKSAVMPTIAGAFADTGSQGGGGNGGGGSSKQTATGFGTPSGFNSDVANMSSRQKMAAQLYAE